ncbi:MAG: RidA family protein [Candidatus Rokubacteria bacterium]|nr:RidA family protein [Candidatus Rokubacteria bacterium]
MSRVSVHTPKVPTPRAPYAQAIRANGLLFVTGQVSRDAVTGDFGDGSFEEQFRRAIKNLDAILTAGGSSRANVTMLTIYMINK